jgi:hypothetical protein
MRISDCGLARRGAEVRRRGEGFREYGRDLSPIREGGFTEMEENSILGWDGGWSVELV